MKSIFNHYNPIPVLLALYLLYLGTAPYVDKTVLNGMYVYLNVWFILIVPAWLWLHNSQHVRRVK